jgi:hypothetical protein
MPETIGLSAGSVYATMTLENAPFLAGLAQSNAAMKAAAQDIEAHFGQVQAALGRVSTGLLAISAVGVAGLVLATREAAAFEKAFAKVAGFTDASTAEIERLKKAVLGMKDLPQMPTELAQGLFYVRSAGFAGADAMTVLHAAGKAAAAGMGETKDVALATVRALTAYQMGASQAAHVTDILQRSHRGVGTLAGQDSAHCLISRCLAGAGGREHGDHDPDRLECRRVCHCPAGRVGRPGHEGRQAGRRRAEANRAHLGRPAGRARAEGSV